MTSIENQRKFILPYNDISKTIFYDQRLGITPPLEIPIMWKISKVEGINPLGVIIYTCVQDFYNSHTDVIEYDQDGNWVGVWADLKAEQNLPGEPPADSEVLPLETIGDYAEFTYSGSKPQLKIKGSYKQLTLTYYNSGIELKNQTPGTWSYSIDDTDASDMLKVIEGDTPNIIKVKFLGGEEYLGKVLTITNTRNGISASQQLEIIAI